MKLLLDTHALIWFTANDPKMPSSLVAQVMDSENTLSINRVSLLEIAIKSQLAKADFPLVFEHLATAFPAV